MSMIIISIILCQKGKRSEVKEEEENRERMMTVTLKDIVDCFSSLYCTCCVLVKPCEQNLKLAAKFRYLNTVQSEGKRLKTDTHDSPKSQNQIIQLSG